MKWMFVSNASYVPSVASSAAAAPSKVVCKVFPVQRHLMLRCFIVNYLNVIILYECYVVNAV